MKSCIIVHEAFDRQWPFAACIFHKLWKQQGSVDFFRIPEKDSRPLGELLPDAKQIERLVSLRIPVTLSCLKSLTGLREAAFVPLLKDDLAVYASQAKIRAYRQESEGFWGQSVAECALALTLCGLRRIPQLHHEIIASHEAWDYTYRIGPNGYTRGSQFCDDLRFTNGTVEGKKVRIVGLGNIGSRYAQFVNMLGADVAGWDPFASDPCFHRSGARKVWHLQELIEDADIFAPMVPLNDSTRGIITEEHIRSLPRGCLVVLATRANVCNVDAVRERVLSDEIALAADVHDVEPLEFDDPLLGRHNVVHTPHIAGRTMNANIRWAEALAAQFLP